MSTEDYLGSMLNAKPHVVKVSPITIGCPFLTLLFMRLHALEASYAYSSISQYK
jgi:hypothetical protein